MLNKEICKKCYKVQGFGWESEFDDDYWERGKVWCHCVPELEYWQKTDEFPSEGCPYYLEHMLKDAEQGSM